MTRRRGTAIEGSDFSDESTAVALGMGGTGVYRQVTEMEGLLDTGDAHFKQNLHPPSRLLHQKQEDKRIWQRLCFKLCHLSLVSFV